MNYTEISLEKLRKISIKEAHKISKEQKIDLLIYVAKAGFPIAKYMNEVFEVPLLGIGAQRKGNKLKQIVGPIMTFMPRFVRDILISFELKSKVHKQDTERHVVFHESLKEVKKEEIRTILVIDDSVDTGHSMKRCCDVIQKEFPEAQIVSYSLNVWEQSKEIFQADYCSFVDTVIRAPMSKDSKEYKKFCKMYDDETRNGYT